VYRHVPLLLRLHDSNVIFTVFLTPKNIKKNLDEVKTFLWSDKIEPITSARLLVAHMWYNNLIVDIDLSDDQVSSNSITGDQNTPGLYALMRCAVLCNRAEFKKNDLNVQKPIMQRECIDDDDGWETGILKKCELHFGNAAQYREKNKKVAEIPFDPENKYQVTFFFVFQDSFKILN
jgi:magnesium-transporting ATPase (P-type)